MHDDDRDDLTDERIPYDLTPEAWSATAPEWHAEPAVAVPEEVR
jgi:hypothetical protein